MDFRSPNLPSLNLMYKCSFDGYFLLITFPVYRILIEIWYFYMRIFQCNLMFFLQDRPSKNKEILRWLYSKRLPNKDGLIPIGRWLRTTSIDELPAWWNILKREMRLVEPNLLLIKYLDHHNYTQR